MSSEKMRGAQMEHCKKRHVCKGCVMRRELNGKNVCQLLSWKRSVLKQKKEEFNENSGNRRT